MQLPSARCAVLCPDGSRCCMKSSCKGRGGLLSRPPPWEEQGEQRNISKRAPMILYVSIVLLRKMQGWGYKQGQARSSKASILGILQHKDTRGIYAYHSNWFKLKNQKFTGKEMKEHPAQQSHAQSLQNQSWQIVGFRNSFLRRLAELSEAWNSTGLEERWLHQHDGWPDSNLAWSRTFSSIVPFHWALQELACWQATVVVRNYVQVQGLCWRCFVATSWVSTGSLGILMQLSSSAA